MLKQTKDIQSDTPHTSEYGSLNAVPPSSIPKKENKSELPIGDRPQPFIPRIEKENSNPIRLGFHLPRKFYYFYRQQYWTTLLNYINNFTIDEQFQERMIYHCAACLAHIAFIEWPELRDNA